MSRVNRFDFTTASELDPPEQHEAGYLFAHGRISRVGVQTYYDAFGRERRELRLPEEVHDAESLRSFAGIPVTNDHPVGQVDSTNARQHVIGAVASMPVADGHYVRAKLALYDAEAIEAARNGRSQISCGYSCEQDETQDPELVKKWGAYDSIQRKIRGNHVAIVDSARAGKGAALRLDSGDAATVFCQAEKAPVESPQQEKRAMPKLTVGKLTFEVTDSNIQAAVDEAISAESKRADAAAARADDAEKKLGTLEAEIDKLEKRADADDKVKCDECEAAGKIDGVKCEHCGGEGMIARKADSYERRLASRDRSTERKADARAMLLDQARSVLGAGADLRNKSDHDIKRMVVRKHFASNPKTLAKLDGEQGKNRAYVESLFDAAIDAVTDAPARSDEAPPSNAPAREDGEDIVEAARKRYDEKFTNQNRGYKKGGK